MRFRTDVAERARIILIVPESRELPASLHTEARLEADVRVLFAIESELSVPAPKSFEMGPNKRFHQQRRHRTGGRELAPFGYRVVPVEVRGCLHLKSACTYLGNETILAHRAWIDLAPLRQYRIVDVAPEEPWAGNTLAVGGTVLIPSAFPATAAILEELGLRVRMLDISELMKAEAALTCSSLIFEASNKLGAKDESSMSLAKGT